MNEVCKTKSCQSREYFGAEGSKGNLKHLHVAGKIGGALTMSRAMSRETQLIIAQDYQLQESNLRDTFAFDLT